MRPLVRRAAAAGLALLSVLIVASPASAGPEKPAGTLSIEGVGSSPILSWSWGVENQTTIGSGSGGAGSGKVVLQEFVITKRINPLSTDLARAVATGQHFPEAVVSVPIGGPGAPFAVEYELRIVIPASIKQSGSSGESLETLSLAYGAFDLTVGNASQQFGLPGSG